MTIQLNFINNSSANNSGLVIFLRPVATNPDQMATAWRVIQNCGAGSSHPFTYPMDFQFGSHSDYGNFKPQLPASQGSSLGVYQTEDGRYRLQLSDTHEFNQQFSLSAKSLSHVTDEAGNAAPSHEQAIRTASEPAMSFAVAAMSGDEQLQSEGVPLEIHADFSLEGIASADIVMTGGYDGETFTPYKLELQNVVWR